jgi:hypothetical protein
MYAIERPIKGKTAPGLNLPSDSKIRIAGATQPDFAAKKPIAASRRTSSDVIELHFGAASLEEICIEDIDIRFNFYG